MAESRRSWKKDDGDVQDVVDFATNRKTLEVLESLAELEKSALSKVLEKSATLEELEKSTMMLETF